MKRLRLLEKSLKRIYLKLESAFNRRLGHEYIPLDLGAFNIETSSACNLKCRFCAYEKKETPRVSMANEMFAKTVEQALELGFNEFHLTPTTGDVFMDKHVFEKFAYLDAHPKVKAYHFFTNLTVLNPAQIEQLTRLKKLSRITVSIYGHDEVTFIDIAKSSSKVFQRLLANLRALLALKPQWPFAVSLGFRSTFDVPAEPVDDLMHLLREFRAAGVSIHASHGIYNNWGGYITQDDVAGLNIKILDGSKTPKLGPCVKLFDGFQVMATGVVNGCSCRDVDATLQIGHIDQAPLKNILSGHNPLYQQIITEQEAGKFRPACEGCDYYRSIYHQPKVFRKKNIPVQTRLQFFRRFNDK
ncbi:radical SAM protein [Dechloromonas sp. XY25]|uniref:Radical SAM protein n=1 Tax=Dechloromonas hankyongensis TaxID=2908002 RepID=A0ABS9JX85_9RHOO|nr:radical SAM/SPASM domain-containing protein [Dechloromonas hankyongensis]MCG2575513.1 radical SAM protein [Dechloromonas hankyongensis]